jgi:hypothetical protein
VFIKIAGRFQTGKASAQDHGTGTIMSVIQDVASRSKSANSSVVILFHEKGMF